MDVLFKVGRATLGSADVTWQSSKKVANISTHLAILINDMF